LRGKKKYKKKKIYKNDKKTKLEKRSKIITLKNKIGEKLVEN
jgi:hypothetical protein